MPAPIVKSKSSKRMLFLDSYAKETLQNLISPINFVLPISSPSVSEELLSFSIIVTMLLAAAHAFTKELKLGAAWPRALHRKLLILQIFLS